LGAFVPGHPGPSRHRGQHLGRDEPQMVEIKEGVESLRFGAAGDREQIVV
jgi:hypothetical protein